MSHPIAKLAGLVGLLIALTGIAFYGASLITADPILQATVQSLGFFGTVVISFVASLNALIPVPPATFAPLFISAGMSFWVVIIGLTIGSSLADSVSYALGWFGRGYVEDHHPKLTEKINGLFQNHQSWILPCTYIYMAISPFPNEYIMVPLAIAGFKYRQLLIPLILGNFFHHSWMTLGYESIFEWLF